MKRNYALSLLLAVVLAVSLSGLLNPFTVLADNGFADKVFDIVEITDLHGNIVGPAGEPVAAVMAANLKALRAANPNRTLIVSGGDNYQGAAISNLTYGIPVMKALNAMGIDASALGNHEFDWGLDKVTGINGSSTAAQYPILCANLVRKNDAFTPVFSPYKIFSLDGVKVAVIGGITERAARSVTAANFSGYAVLNDVDCINKYARQARNNGAQIVIALLHGGDNFNKGASGPIVDIAHELVGVDAVLGGHTHTVAQTMVANAEGKNIPLEIGSYNGKGYIDLKLTWHADGSISSSNATSAYIAEDTVSTAYPYGYMASSPVLDDTVKQIVADAIAEEERILNEELGSTPITLTRQPADSPFGDSTAGNWAADVTRTAGSARIGFQSNGRLCCDIPQGNITRSTIYQFMPFDDEIITCAMTGAQLKTILEEAVMDNGKGIQVSGLKFVYDPDKPSLSRVVSISLSDGKPIDMEDRVKAYKVAISDYIAGGTDTSPKDGFTFASQSSNIADTHIVFRNALVKAIKSAGSNGISASIEKRVQNIQTASPVKPPIITNITDIAGTWAEANINSLVKVGAISGYPDGSFKHDKTITRAEFASLMVKAFNLKAENGKVFMDTAQHWARDYIATANALGIASGYGGSAFGPDDHVTREQMAAMIVKAAKLATLTSGKSFTDDSQISPWAKSAVITASGNQIMAGYPNGTFIPQGATTRAEAVTVVVKALKW